MTDEPKCLLQQQILGEQIEVWQQLSRRWLSIDSIIQSSIDIEQPQSLTSAVYPALLSALLFINNPRKVLLAGTGGGAIARYLHHRAPDIAGDAIEINPAIVDIARRYFGFPEKPWQLHIHDIRLWDATDYDIIFLDVAEREYTPDWVTGETLLERMKHQLSNNGVLVINLLVTDAQALLSKLKNIRNTFDRRTLCLSVPHHNNIVVFAFNLQPDFRTPKELESRLTATRKKWGVDFRAQLERLTKENPIGSGIF